MTLSKLLKERDIRPFPTDSDRASGTGPPRKPITRVRSSRRPSHTLPGTTWKPRTPARPSSTGPGCRWLSGPPTSVGLLPKPPRRCPTRTTNLPEPPRTPPPFEGATEFIAEQEWPSIRAHRAIQGRFQQHVEAGRVPQEVAPENWTRFCDNLYTIISSNVEGHPRAAVIRGLVDTALDAIDSEIAESSGARFPRSTSLLQFSLGALAKRRVLTSALQRYVPLLTDELLDLFPEVRVLGNRFDLEVSEVATRSQAVPD